MDYSGKKITVLGLGLSGYSAAKLLIELGASVFVSDSGSCPELEERAKELRVFGAVVELGGHSDEVFRLADEIVISPGIPPDLDILRRAIRMRPDLPIIPEIELGFRVTKGWIIGVTGSNGKSTTVTLLGELFKAAGREHYVVGNIGRPFCDVALSASEDAAICIELSSFQLEGILDFRPFVACLLNLTVDHIDRHKSKLAYYTAKQRILENQIASDYSVLSMDDSRVAMLASETAGRAVLFGIHDLGVTGAFIRNNVLTIKDLDGKISSVLPAEELGIPGPHNLSNACAALACSLPFSLPVDAMATALREFKGLPHRLQRVATIDGVQYINDSKATNLDSLAVSLRSFDRRVVLIAGGYDKGADFSRLRDIVSSRVKRAFLIGDTADRIASDWKDATRIEKVSTLPEAVLRAREAAEPGETVLLAPGCASYDMFKNFEERGNNFIEIVEDLKK